MKSTEGYAYNWFPFQYSRNQHNIAKQLYFSKVFFLKKGSQKQTESNCILYFISLNILLPPFKPGTLALSHTSSLYLESSDKNMLLLRHLALIFALPTYLLITHHQWCTCTHVRTYIVSHRKAGKNSQLPWDRLAWKSEDWWRAHCWEDVV